MSMVSCLENLRSGATTIRMDFMYALRDPALHAAVIQAMVDSGVRGRYTRTVADGGEEMGIPFAMRQPARRPWLTPKLSRPSTTAPVMAGWTSGWPSA